MRMHLAELIEDEMVRRMVAPDDDAREIAITSFALDMFLAVREPYIVLGKLADQFSRALGPDAQFFVNLHEAWRAEQGGAA